jgi:hypothetical protein
MTLTELRDLKAKSFLALKAIFAASLGPVTVQQIHPMQLGAASSLHMACCRELAAGLDPGEGGYLSREHRELCAALYALIEEKKLTKADTVDAASWVEEISTMLHEQLAADHWQAAGGPQA